MVKNLPARQETWVWSLSQEDSPEEEMATHYSILAWRIPLTVEPGGLQSMGLKRLGLDWVNNTKRRLNKPRGKPWREKRAEGTVGRFPVEEVSMESCQTPGGRAARSRRGPSEPESGERWWFQAPRRPSSLCDLPCCFSPISWEERQIQEDRVPQTGPVLWHFGFQFYFIFILFIYFFGVCVPDGCEVLLWVSILKLHCNCQSPQSKSSNHDFHWMRGNVYLYIFYSSW